jgi:hypothetical protein
MEWNTDTPAGYKNGQMEWNTDTTPRTAKTASRRIRNAPKPLRARRTASCSAEHTPHTPTGSKASCSRLPQAPPRLHHRAARPLATRRSPFPHRAAPRGRSLPPSLPAVAVTPPQKHSRPVPLPPTPDAQPKSQPRLSIDRGGAKAQGNVFFQDAAAADGAGLLGGPADAVRAAGAQPQPLRRGHGGRLPRLRALLPRRRRPLPPRPLPRPRRPSARPPLGAPVPHRRVPSFLCPPFYRYREQVGSSAGSTASNLLYYMQD